MKNPLYGMSLSLHKPAMFAPKLKSILLHKIICGYAQEVSVYSVSTAQCKRVCFSGGHFADPVMSQLRELPLWRAPIG